MKTTREIAEEYNVSRQTIQSWIREGLLEAPQKDHRNWFIWNSKDEQRLRKIINSKVRKNNTKTMKQGEIINISNRRYLGSKQKLLGFIEEVIDNHTKNVESVADIFGGTGVVSALFRKKGKKIIINDILKSNYVSYQTWFGNENVNYTKVKKIIHELNSIQPDEDNYVSKNFGDKYFSLENARKIGEIRERIEGYEVNKREKSFLLTSLMYAMDKVANTVGHYDAYRKKMDSYDPIHLRVPVYFENKNNEIYCEDANQLVRKIQADLVYIDTPYNSRQYGDAYHLLENIIEWKKPKVMGIARKMINRSHIKSDYSTKKAPIVFEDLIQNINSKYILVSYNNMAQKGNGRSNAKISNEEILQTLEARGKVQVFEMPFQVFTTGRTNIDDHKELLYLCEIDNKKKVRKYTRSAINYIGGKYKLLPQIVPLFPKNIRDFYDVFSGGANVGINVEVKGKVIINDIEKNLIELYKFIRNNDYHVILRKIKFIIQKYNLSDTQKNGYHFYKANSSDGLKDVNKKAYEQLREDYNNQLFSEEERPLIFYVLIVYAFNNQIRFNSQGLFNMPTGKRDFNQNMQLKLKEFKEAISRENVCFSNKDFREVIGSVINKNDFVYLDPPYLITNATYNENGGWSEQDEKDLLKSLDDLDKKGIRFALSNVLLHKGVENRLLIEWAANYKIHYLDFHYNNSNYQSKAINNKTVEVLITNY